MPCAILLSGLKNVTKYDPVAQYIILHVEMKLTNTKNPLLLVTKCLIYNHPIHRVIRIGHTLYTQL